MKKKIGILTMYYTNISHGGLLQAYSFCKVLQRMGYDAEQIKYDYNVRFRNLSFKSKLKKIIKKIPYSILSVINNDKTESKYYEYMEEIAHSDYCTTETIESICEKYDYLVVGSDQVWNMAYCDNNFFFPFSLDVKKIAYAASVGKDVLDYSELKDLVNNIKDFSAVSVREKKLAEQLNEYSKANVGFVCDPVFLNSVSFWRKHAIKSKFKERYTLVYILGTDKMEKKLAYETARKIGLKIVTIPNVNIDMRVSDFTRKEKRLFNIGPKEFLGLIDGADYVLTDSFHCTAFSIIFNKDFYAFSRPNKEFSMNSRIFSILSEVNLKDRFIDLNNINSFLARPIDYQKSNHLLANFIEKSYEWIENALK